MAILRRFGGARAHRSASRGDFRLRTWLLVVGLLLIVNSAYVAAFSTPDLFYVSNDLLHPALGLAAGILLLALAVRQRDLFAGSTGALALGFLGVAAGAGVYLAIVGMTRPHSLALYLHVGSAIAGLFFLLVHLRKFRNSKSEIRDSNVEVTPPKPEDSDARISSFDARLYRWSAGVMLGSLALYAAVVGYRHFFPDSRYIIRNPPTAPLSMDQEGGGTLSLMFPSSARTSDGKPIQSAFFMNSESCQRCHPDIYAEWQSSMHHMASFNNQWYRKSIEYMQDTVGIKPSLWCGGCHDHALIIAGKMQKFPIRDIEDTPAGQNGLGCMSCHAIVHVDSTMGQGGITFEYPKLAELAESPNPFLRFLHDYDTRLDPKPHRFAFLKPFHHERQQSPEFCSACHKVHLDVPVNHYRWFRGFDDYDNWQASGVSGQGARSFYYPPKPQTCVDCHMPLVPSKDFGNINGSVHSHRFAAANAAVPTSYDDGAQVAAVEKFLKGALSLDIFALAEEPGEGGAATSRGVAAGEGPQLSSTFAIGEESSAGLAAAVTTNEQPARLEAPLGRASAEFHPGETVRVEVVVRTRRLGHFFPAGTVDAFDCWLELRARDSKGRVIFWSGAAADDGKGPVDPGAHFYKSLQIDEHGNVINKRNAWSTRSTVYARLIPPGAADTVHFRLNVPSDAGDHITLTAKLNYRKFSWWITQWAFAGARDPADPHPAVSPSYDDGHWVFTQSTAHDSERIAGIPDVPIVVVAEDSKTVPVSPQSPPAFAESVPLDSRDWERWNDYGIGLLLQGDLKGAERAFETVTKVRPNYADGWVNVARARIQEGNTEAARPLLAAALRLDPNLASAHYFLGLALKTAGDYPGAYEQFQLAAARYPRDRVNRNQMGRMLFLQRKYREAVAEYEHTLSIDPEDLEAHYNLMLCYRGLDDDQLATREEKLYLRFKANEAAQAITGPYKLAHPQDNNEAQPIHEHVSSPLGQAKGRSQYAVAHRPKAVAGGLKVSERALIAGGPASK